MNNTYYGSYRTRTFCDIFEDATTFMNSFKATIFYTSLNRTIEGVTVNEFTDGDISLVFYMLYARYGNSHIASSDENQFKYKLFMIFFQFGPSWKKKLDVQKELRHLSLSDITRGTVQINNHALNPDQSPSTDAFDALTYINEQNASGIKKSPLEGYNNLLALVDNDVTEEFISKFKRLFLQIVEPEKPLWYSSDSEDPDQEV